MNKKKEIRNFAKKNATTTGLEPATSVFHCLKMTIDVIFRRTARYHCAKQSSVRRNKRWNLCHDATCSHGNSIGYLVLYPLKEKARSIVAGRVASVRHDLKKECTLLGLVASFTLGSRLWQLETAV